MSTTALNIIILVINCVLWVFFFIQFKRFFSPSRILDSIKDEVDKLLVEIDKSADRDLTLIEERTRNLRAVIEEADKRVQLAVSEERKAEMSASISQNVNKKIQAQTRMAAQAYQRAKPQPAENTHADEFTYKPEAHKQVKPVVPEQLEPKTQIKEQNELPFEVSISPDFVQTEKTIQQKVIDLMHSGFDNEKIAEMLSIAESEVQMIIDLFS